MTNDKTPVFEPVETRDRNGREQQLYRFDNGYGASALRCHGAPGSPLVWWDLVVIAWHGKTFNVVFDSPITNGVLDSLAGAEVHEALSRIKALPMRGRS